MSTTQEAMKAAARKREEARAQRQKEEQKLQETLQQEQSQQGEIIVTTTIEKGPSAKELYEKQKREEKAKQEEACKVNDKGDLVITVSGGKKLSLSFILKSSSGVLEIDESKLSKFWVVVSGDKPGVYTTKKSYEKAIAGGFGKCVSEEFHRAADAEAWLDAFGEEEGTLGYETIKKLKAFLFYRYETYTKNAYPILLWPNKEVYDERKPYEGLNLNLGGVDYPCRIVKKKKVEPKPKMRPGPSRSRGNGKRSREEADSDSEESYESSRRSKRYRPLAPKKPTVFTDSEDEY